MLSIPNRAKSAALLALAVAGTSAILDAQVVVDFESFNLNGQVFLDTPEMVVLTNVGGSNTNVTIQGFDDLRIYDMFLYGSGGFPGVSQGMIDMNWNNFNNPNGTDIVFDPPVDNVSLLAGDFGGDDDSPLMIVAYDSAGAVLGSASAPWPANVNPPLVQLAVNATGIKRIHYSSGGSFQSSTFVDDITFTPGSVAPATYCTAKTNSLGCTPAIGFTGAPSASAGSGFTIQAGQFINNKNGLLFYSTTGADALAFRGGFLCAKAPLKFTPLQNSGGNPPPNDCSGSYSIDFNAFIATGLDPALVSGQAVWSQHWSRDPADPFTTGLSDALQFTIAP